MPPAFLASVDRIQALQHVACTKTSDVPCSTAFILFQTTMAVCCSSIHMLLSEYVGR